MIFKLIIGAHATDLKQLILFIVSIEMFKVCENVDENSKISECRSQILSLEKMRPDFTLVNMYVEKYFSILL